MSTDMGDQHDGRLPLCCNYV